MAKVPAKKTNPMLWVALGVLAIVAYVATAPDDSAKTASKPASAKSASKTGVTSIFTPEDFKVTSASFATFNEKPADSFKPLVVRSNGPSGLGEKGGLLDDIGGPGWVYSGMAGINNVDTGILENPTTDEHDFVVNGQHWKSAVVRGIYPDHLDLETADKIYKVYTETKDDSDKPGKGAAPALPGVSSVAMQGAIGGNNLNITPDPTASPALDTGTGRRGRRNRNAFNNGGGNFNGFGTGSTNEN